MDLPRLMSKTPDALLSPLPTSLPWSSNAVNRTPDTGAGGFFRVSVRHPWMWIVSSSRGAGFVQADAPAACDTGAAEAAALPVSTTTAATRATRRAAMLLGRAGMGLLSRVETPVCRRCDAGL